MPQVEAWERVYIIAEDYQNDVHAFINCTDCHGGQAVDDMDTAHQDMLDPFAMDATPEDQCAGCHPDIAPHAANSLHNTLGGYDTALYARSSEEHYAALEEMQEYHCNSCHATCGECHVSQPNSVGGGLLEGHVFVEAPPMSRTCTGCHGSRVKNEFYGMNEEAPQRDVHLQQARLQCIDCHTGSEMHGMIADPDNPGQYLAVDNRYDGPREPTCESCHADDIGVGSGIAQHELHGTEILSCQACHSVAYTNCTNCHVQRTEDDVPYYSVEEHWVGFYLGQNTLRSAERPYRYVPVRHVPIDPNSFDFYGDNLLDNFSNHPTWTYATPHNIQLKTPQTESCESCHENDDVFLTPDKVAPSELEANQGVIVESAPLLPDGYPEDFAEYLPAAEEAPAEGGEEDTGSFWDTDSGGGDDGGEEDTGSFWDTDSGSDSEAEEDSGESDTGSFWD